MIRLLLVTLLVSFVQGSCPSSNYYGPCLCLEENDGFISLQCTGVSDGVELLEVFRTVPDSYISSVDINDSPSLMELPNDLFGDKSVGAFRISSTGISEAQTGLVGSPSTTSLTEYLIRRNSNMKTLKGEAIAGLTGLTSFQATFNGITSLSTVLPFSPVTELSFLNNNIDQIVESFFKQPASISSVDLAFNNLTTASLIPRCLEFSGQVQFLSLDLSWNKIANGIPSDALQETIPCQLFLSGNGITSLDSSTYSTLFRNMFFLYGSDGECFIALDNNPLNCECSMAWVTDPGIKDMIVDDATCSDGRLVTDLTAADFQGC